MKCKKCNHRFSDDQMQDIGDGWLEYQCEECSYIGKFKPIKAVPADKVLESVRKAGVIVILPPDFGDK